MLLNKETKPFLFSLLVFQYRKPLLLKNITVSTYLQFGFLKS